MLSDVMLIAVMPFLNGLRYSCGNCLADLILGFAVV